MDPTTDAGSKEPETLSSAPGRWVIPVFVVVGVLLAGAIAALAVLWNRVDSLNGDIDELQVAVEELSAQTARELDDAEQRIDDAELRLSRLSSDVVSLQGGSSSADLLNIVEDRLSTVRELLELDIEMVNDCHNANWQEYVDSRNENRGGDFTICGGP